MVSASFTSTDLIAFIDYQLEIVSLYEANLEFQLSCNQEALQRFHQQNMVFKVLFFPWRPSQFMQLHTESDALCNRTVGASQLKELLTELKEGAESENWHRVSRVLYAFVDHFERAAKSSARKSEGQASNKSALLIAAIADYEDHYRQLYCDHLN